MAGLEYACRLKALADDVSDTLCIVMRVYSKNHARRSAGKATSTIHSWTTPSSVDVGMEKARAFLLAVNELRPAGRYRSTLTRMGRNTMAT